MSTSFRNRFVPVRVTRDYGTNELYEQYIQSHVREYYTAIILNILCEHGINNYMSENGIFLQWPIITNEVVCEYITNPQKYSIDQLFINKLYQYNADLCTSYHINKTRLCSKIYSPFPWNAPVLNERSSRVIDNQTNLMLNP
jgi:hypothetical protein